MNYRSAVVMGRAGEVAEPAAKTEALKVIVEHSSVPGRWAEVRPPSPQELAATTVVALSLEHCSAKVRTGHPVDNEEDLALPVWTGEIPLQVRPCTPIPTEVAQSSRSVQTPVTLPLRNGWGTFTWEG